MATKAKFVKRCTELGVTYEDNGFCLCIDAPKGKTFGTFDTHSEALFYRDGWKMSEMYDEFIHVMSMGLIDCDESECEICNS